jgi:hypothetical protein
MTLLFSFFDFFKTNTLYCYLPLSSSTAEIISTMRGINTYTLSFLLCAGIANACVYPRYVNEPGEDLAQRRCQVGVSLDYNAKIKLTYSVAWVI